MSLTTESFTFVADLVRSRSAIHLAPGKEYLVESRLLPLARRRGVTVDEYVRTQRTRPDQLEAELIVEALTTNETSWFRDALPFQALTDHILPETTSRLLPGAPLRIWSAACSTGQEPYSIAMVLREQLGTRRAEITATDLSGEVLDKARAGLYSQLEVNRGLPVTFLVKHFTKVGAQWQIADDIRSTVRFSKHNLLSAPPAGGPFDIVFLRNVLIYFDVGTKRTIIGRVKRLLPPDGHLFLGAAETTMNIDDGFERLPLERAGCYRRTTGV